MHVLKHFFYNTVHYSMILDKTQFNPGPAELEYALSLQTV